MIRLLPVTRLVTTWYFILLFVSSYFSKKFLYEYEHQAFKGIVLAWAVVLIVDALRIWAGKSS